MYDQLSKIIPVCLKIICAPYALDIRINLCYVVLCVLHYIILHMYMRENNFVKIFCIVTNIESLIHQFLKYMLKYLHKYYIFLDFFL